MIFWQVFSRQMSINKYQSTLKQGALMNKERKNKIAPVSFEHGDLTIISVLG